MSKIPKDSTFVQKLIIQLKFPDALRETNIISFADYENSYQQFSHNIKKCQALCLAYTRA